MSKDMSTLDSIYVHLYNGGSFVAVRKKSETALELEVSSTFFGKSQSSISFTLSSEQLAEIGTMFLDIAKNCPTKQEELSKP